MNKWKHKKPQKVDLNSQKPRKMIVFWEHIKQKDRVCQMQAILIKFIHMEVNMEKKIWIILTFPLEINGTKYKLIVGNKYFKIQAKIRKLLLNKQITKDPPKKALAQNSINDSSLYAVVMIKIILD